MTVETADVRPTSIELDRKSHLTLTWDDGLAARFDITDLRQACPCAGCRNRRETGQRSVPDDGRPVEATDGQLVGSYALGVEWLDGLCNSIYTFDTLRRWAELVRDQPDVSDDSPTPSPHGTDTDTDEQLTDLPAVSPTLPDSGSFS